MRNSESLTQECTLDVLSAGKTARVVSIDEDRRPALAAHGVRPGVDIVVDQDAPFGGPRIVRLGGVRVALARLVARAVRVRFEGRSSDGRTVR